MRQKWWLGLSFVLLSAFAVFGLKSPYGGLGGWSGDMISHVNSSVLFYYRGFDVYRHPIAKTLAPDTSPSAQAYAASLHWPGQDVFGLAERRGKPPLLINWSFMPRPYPPGIFLYTLPEAVLGEAFGVSVGRLRVVSLIKFLLIAHLLFWFLLPLVNPPDESPAEMTRALALYILLPLLYLEIMLWTLSGLYDGIAILALVLCARAIGARQYGKGILCYAAAVFLHFRALWYLPLLGFACFQLLNNGDYRKLGIKGAAALALSAVLLCLSAYSFWLILPALKQLQPTNFFFVSGMNADTLARLSYLLVPLAFVSAGLYHNRSWLLLSCLGWTVFMLLRTPFLQMWHSLFLIPLFALAGVEGRSPFRARLLVLAAYLVLSSLAFTYFPFTGKLAMDVIKEIAG